jgi:hypothetical protein
MARIYLDLSDVVIHSFWSDTISGIQRVQLAIGAAIVSSVPEASAFFLHENIWSDVTSLLRNNIGQPDKALASLRRRYGYLGHYPTRMQPLRRFKRRFRPRIRKFYDLTRPQLTSADTLFIGGGFTAKPNNLNYTPTH